MPTYRDIFNLNLKYIEYLLEKTSLTQGYMRNVNVTGDEIEQEVRRLLKNLLPQRFQVTHGYIISAVSKQDEPLVSPQIDVIIVDTLVPHSIFIVDQHRGMEVVPIEAVVGIFEVKRTLNKDSLLGTIKAIGTEKEEGAVKQLRDICEKVGIRKDNADRFLPGGIRVDIPFIEAGYYSNPIMGIIGVDHDKDIGEKLKAWVAAEQKIDFGMVDIIFSLNGYMACLGVVNADGQTTVSIQTCRQKGQEYKTYINYAHPRRSKTEIVAMALGFIVGYVSHTSGRKIEINNYFFNDSLSELS